MARRKNLDTETKKERLSRVKKACYDLNTTRQAFLYLINKEEDNFIDLLKTKQVDIDKIFLLTNNATEKISITIREYVLLFYKSTDSLFIALRNYALTMPIPYEMEALFGKGKKKSNFHGNAQNNLYSAP